MKNRIYQIFVAFLLAIPTLHAQEKPSLTWKDIPSWEYIRFNSLAISNDGQWAGYVDGPTEGDLTLSLKAVHDTLTYTYPIGGAQTRVDFNEQSTHVAFLEATKYKDIKANEKARKPSYKTLRLVSLADTASVTFQRVNSFGFSNENGQWIAIRFQGEGGQGQGPGNRTESASKGSDLLLYHISTKQSFNVGHVNEFAFNKNGRYLVYTVNALQQNGNGLFLRDLHSGVTYALDNDKATYSKINWNKEGTAFALLKAKEDKDYKDPVYTLIGIKEIDGNQSKVISYAGLGEDEITSGYGISENSTPYWSHDLNTIFFGIASIEASEKKRGDGVKESVEAVDSIASTIDQASDSTAIARRPTKPAADNKKKDLEKPDMIIWNWQDTRLQSAQRTQQRFDKNYTTLSALHIGANRFVSLADSALKRIYLSNDHTVGYGFDYTPYEYESNLDGQSYADVYIIDIETGQKRLGIEKLYLNASRGISLSPEGRHLLYFSEGHYHVLDTRSLLSTNLTVQIPHSFVNQKVDNNVADPATPNYGWSSDGRYVFLRDNFDLWRVEVGGKGVTALTDNWKVNHLAVQRPVNLYPDDEFLDLKKDQYFFVFNDLTKEGGIARLAAGKKELDVLLSSPESYRLVTKPKNANSLFFSKENSNTAPELFVSTQRDLSASNALTTNTVKKKDFAFSSGERLISYVNDFGDTLQATIFLPANYVEGQSYPTITYIYERLTDGTYAYANPAFPGGGFNRAVYTSNGYAVLMPDITYKLNDPGMSAVACVVPAVQAAIATGIVDEDNVAIHGHSWGGYQTSFLITQTDIFKAAVAGAPLTNMISMYSLIYWNTGSANQSIFESSQGRLTTGYWDNWDAYVRNSPISHIKNVKTPLIIMHNDKDGAVDYTQGIEYFNGLRRLGKPVVMLTYNGENHGLVKDVNKKDYAVRMMEFFDHHLKGAAAPDWWESGIDYIDLDKHLEERAF